MVIIDDVLVSDEVLQKTFVCNLTACKGACCVEGDLGAPIEEAELPIIKENLPAIIPFMSDIGKKVLKEQGFAEKDFDNEWVTTTFEGGACVFAIEDKEKIWKCAIENAHSAGKINFKKPISCHLYPIRVTQNTFYKSLNYNKWDICSPACSLGEMLQVPVYQFLKEPLERKFGKMWFEALEYAAKTNED